MENKEDNWNQIKLGEGKRWRQKTNIVSVNPACNKRSVDTFYFSFDYTDGHSGSVECRLSFSFLSYFSSAASQSIELAPCWIEFLLRLLPTSVSSPTVISHETALSPEMFLLRLVTVDNNTKNSSAMANAAPLGPTLPRHWQLCKNDRLNLHSVCCDKYETKRPNTPNSHSDENENLRPRKIDVKGIFSRFYFVDDH